MSATELLLIDISGLAHQAFHVSGNEPDPNFISTQVISRVRALASNHPHAAICCDSGKSFRKDIDPAYKANRDTENRAVIAHQVTLACERLAGDGFPIWKVAGFEADDLIASATAKALAIDGATVLIASDDKDLLQLVNGRVAMKKTREPYSLMDSAAVVDKFGVQPSQMLDYLSLVGDKSDNIVGAEGIGAVKAAAILKEFGSLSAVYAAMGNGDVKQRGITPAMRTSLVAFQERLPTVAQLITLRTDAPVPFEEIAAERTPKDADVYQETDDAREQVESILGGYGSPAPLHSEGTPPIAVPTSSSAGPAETGPSAPNGGDSGSSQSGEWVRKQFVGGSAGGGKTQSLAIYEPAPVADFSLQLEPRTPEEAAKLSGHLFNSRLFSAYGTWQGVLSTVLAGRELGIPALAALRAFHIIENRPCLSADTVAALVLKSGKAKFFRVTQRTPTVAAFKTQRTDDDEPIELAYTIEEARQAWKKDQKAWDASGWGKNPADMLVARAKSKLARLVYPDVVGGLYAVEEME